MTDYVCMACGARQEHNLIRCETCGKPLVFSAAEVKAERERAEARRDPRQRTLFEGEWRAVDETSYGNGWVVLDPDWMAGPRRHYCSSEKAARRYAALRSRAWRASPFGKGGMTP